MAWLKRRYAWLGNPPAHMGRRGAVLLIIGVVWVLIGLSAYIEPGLDDRDLGFLSLPPALRLALWAGAGILAVGSAWLPPRRSDAIGFTALAAMPLVRAGSYGWAWLMELTHDDPAIGYGRGWVGALVWASVFILIVTIAGWREPPPIPVHPGDDDG